MGIYDWQEKHIAKQDARIAELTAEVEKYKKALEIIAQYDDGYAIPANDGPTRIEIARNALKEG